MPIDDYVLALDRRLVGPRRVKRDLLAEARDSLVDAAEAYEAAGLDRGRAEARAITEFGAAARLAPAYQVELAASAARRVALLAVSAVIAGVLLTDRMWQGAPWADVPPPPGYGFVARSLDVMPYLLGTAAVVALLALRRQARTGGDPRWLCRAVGAGALATVGLTTGLGLALYVATITMWPAALTWPPMIVGGAAVMAAGAWQLVAARRCLRAAMA